MVFRKGFDHTPNVTSEQQGPSLKASGQNLPYMGIALHGSKHPINHTGMLHKSRYTRLRRSKVNTIKVQPQCLVFWGGSRANFFLACGPKTAHAKRVFFDGWEGVGWGKMLPSCEPVHILDATLPTSSLDFHTSLMPRYRHLL